MSDEVQGRILARRARFIALTLAGAGCTPAETAQPPVVVVAIPPPDAAAVQAPVVDASAVIEAAAPVADAGVGDAGVSAATQLRYDRVRARVVELSAVAPTIEASIAKARAVSTPAGKADWLTIVEAIDAAAQSIGMMAIYCPSPERPETVEFMRWTEGERAKLQTTLDAVRAKAFAKLKDKTMTGEARFEALLNEGRSAHPRPCLSIACDHW